MKKLLTATLVSLAFASTASATQFFIDVGVDYNASSTAPTAAGGNTTGWKDELAVTYRSDSVVTDVDGNGIISDGDTILTAGGRIAGAEAGANIVTALTVSETLTGGPSDNGYGSNWEIGFRFTDLAGAFDSSVGNFVYESGNIDWVLIDSTFGVTNEVSLFTTTITGSEVLSGNQIFTGTVGDFGQGTVNGVEIGDIFNIATGTGSEGFESYALATGDIVTFRIDANTDVNAIPTSFGSAGTLNVGAQHDGSVTFDVPEPASVAILGLGLLGFAASRRKA